MVKKKAKNIAYCFVIAILSAVFMFGSTACGCTPDFSDAPEFKTKVIADFKDGELPDVFFASDGWNNGGSFNVEWDASAVSYSDGAANLSVLEKPDGEEGSVPEVPYYGGELRSQKWYHYGFYSAKMKPSAVEGTCTSFFVYTGPSELGADGEANPWDEVDIEFLGKNTREVQFNFFANGSTGNEYVYELDFDASKEYHEYGFYWEKDRITWYVDGKPVYRVTSEEKTLPSTPGRIMMNHWSGNAEGEGWMGKYTADTSTSSYKTISCTADPMDPYVKPETPPEGGEYDPSVFDDAETTSLTFFTEVPDVYTLDPAGTATDTVNVTYTANGSSYNNVAADISVSDKNAFSMKITNNADTETNVRINMIAVTAPSANNASCNVYATYEGENVRTDSEWGGSFVTVPAKSSGYVNVWYASPIKQVQFMIDSHLGDSTTRSGDVTFSEFKFAMDDGVEFDDTVPETPEPPTEQELLIDGMYAWGGYTLAKAEDNKSVEVTYGTETPGVNQWAAVAQDFNSGIFGSNDIFSVKVENKGTSSVVFRVNIENAESTSFVKSASYTDETGAVTDAVGGGGYMGNITLAAGKTVTVKVVFEKDPSITRFSINFDSHTDAYATASGDILLSEFKLSSDPILQVPGDQTAPSDSDGIALGTINQWGGYTVTPSSDGTSFRITYAGLSQQWAGFGCDLTSEMVSTATTLSMKVKNDGTSASSFKVDVGTKPTEGDLVNKVTAASYTDADGSHDVTLGSYMVTIPAGETVTLTVTFTNDNINGMNIFVDSLESDYASAVGNLVFSDLKFA